MMTTKIVSSLLLCAAIGCVNNKNGDSETASSPSKAVDSSKATNKEKPEDDIVEEDIALISFNVDPKVLEACDHSAPEVFFKLDSAKLTPSAIDGLKSVSKCVNSEPLARAKLLLVGHASPPGTDKYNDKLGKTRAEAVRDYLVEHGVAKDRIVLQSLGEAGMDKLDKRGWPLARRVDLRLM